MSHITRLRNGGPIPPGGGILHVQTEDGNNADPDINSRVFFQGRPATPLTVSNIVTSGDNASTFYAAVTDAIYLPATNAIATSGVYGIENLPVLHTRGVAGVASNNVGVGIYALNLGINNGLNNTTFGSQSMTFINDGSDNFAGGTFGLRYITDGSRNTAVGSRALGIPGFVGGFTGDDNISIGYSSSNLMDQTSHDNIVIGNQGGPGINSTIIIGNTVAPHNHTACYIHGIRGYAGGTDIVTIDAAGRLGTTAIVPAGVQQFNIPVGGPVFPTVGGVVTLRNGPNIAIDSPAANEIRVSVTPNIDLLATNVAGTQGVYLFAGQRYLHIGQGAGSVFFGRNAGNFAQTGALNTCIGETAGNSLAAGAGAGFFNTIIGGQSGQNITTGAYNTLCGGNNAPNITTAQMVTTLGYNAGFIGDNGQLNNIWIGNWGAAGVNDRITIGTNISNAPEQRVHTACYIHGIWTQPVAAGYQQVVIDAAGKLGSIVVGPGAGITYRAKNATTTTATGAGVITFTGDANVNSIAGGNAVTYSLANSITINNNITATLGTITAAAGSVVAGLNVNAGNQLNAVHGIRNTTDGGIISFGPTRLVDGTMQIGVVQSDAAGNIFSDAGPAGRFLISQGAGLAPQWRTVTSTGGTITVTYDAAHNINIEAGAVAGIEFYAKDLTHSHQTGGNFQFTGDGNVKSTAYQGPPGYSSITYGLENTINIVQDVNAGRDVSTVRNVHVGTDLTVDGNSYTHDLIADGDIQVLNTTIPASGNLNTARAITAGTTVTATTSVIAGTNVQAGANVTAGNNVTATNVMVAGNGITSTNGNIRAASGSVIANQQLISQINGCDITGAVYLRTATLPTGVCQMTAGQQLVSSNANANGQILIGAAAGGNPIWNTLTAGAGITITNGANSISIAATGGGGARAAFSTYLSADTGAIWGTLPMQFIGSYDGSVGSGTRPLVQIYNNGGTLSLGSAGNPARYTAITAGLYNFVFKVRWQDYQAPYRVEHLRSIMYMIHQPSGFQYVYQHGFFKGVGNQFCDNEFVATIYLGAGEYVQFALEGPTLVGNVIGITQQTYISGFLVS